MSDLSDEKDPRRSPSEDLFLSITAHSIIVWNLGGHTPGTTCLPAI